MIESLSGAGRDLRLAARALLRARAFSVTVVVTLAVGLGLNAAIFTVVDCVLLRPLGFRNADRIVAVESHFDDEHRSIPRLGGGDYNDLTREVPGFEAVAWYNSFPDALQIRGQALYTEVAVVAPTFARVLGVQPVAGRLFNPSDKQGTDVLVSAGFARAHFGSPQAALGAPLTYSGATYTIAGVLPRGFHFPAKSELWFEHPADIHESRTSYSDSVIGLRRRDVSPAQLDAQLRDFTAHLHQSFPEDRSKSILAIALREELVGSVRPSLLLLMGGAGILLLVVCANLASLQLVRATRNARTLTIRTALGASRAAVARYALLETTLLGLAGAVGALAVAAPTLALLRLLAPANLPRLAEVQLNPEVFGYSLALSLLVMAVAALLPVWRSWHVDPVSALKSDSSRGTESRGTARLRESFLVAQIALTLTLSVAAVLLGQHLLSEDQQQLGFTPDHLVVLDTHLVLSTTPPLPAPNQTPEQRAGIEAAWHLFGERNLQRMHSSLATVRAVPGVVAADSVSGAPMGYGDVGISYAVRGRQVFAPGQMDLPSAEVRAATEGLFRTLGVPLLRGRTLSDTADRYNTQRVAVINQALARQSFPGIDPVGQQIVCGFDTEGDAPNATWLIVGVVGDVRNNSPAELPEPSFYVPLAQHPDRVPDVQIVARVEGEPNGFAEQLRHTLLAQHPDLAVKATTMPEAIQVTERPDQFRSILFGSFAAVSLLLAAVGTYGVSAYTAEQRRREWALRMALGAARTDVLGLVLRRTLLTTLLGAALGAGVSLALGRSMASVLGAGREVEPALGYALAAAAVLAVALLASAIPAQRAARVEPMEALRSD